MFSLGPMWERVSKGKPQADCVSDSLPLSKEWANSAMPLSVPDNSQEQARAGSWLQIQVRKPWEQETACAWRMRHWKPHKNRRQLVCRWSKRCREKPYSVALNKIHNNVTFTFVPLMSFLTQRLCNMLDSQALAFNVTFEKSFIHFFSTNIYWTNSARCQEYKDDYLPSLLLEGIGNNSNLIHLQTPSSFQRTTYII